MPHEKVVLYYDVARLILFFAMVIICSVTEIRENKIYNIVTIPAFFAGLGLNYLAAGPDGFKSSVMGFGVGFGTFLLFYLMKGIGPGDVKLAGAIGAMQGFSFTVNTILWTAIIGGMMALLVVVGVTGLVLTKRIPARKMPHIPYGLAMCLAGVVSFFPGAHLFLR